jgi:hypothetical protein
VADLRATTAAGGEGGGGGERAPLDMARPIEVARRQPAKGEGVLDMSGNVEAKSAAAQPQGYERSRLNAVRHGILSRHLLLPWEDRSEYDDLLESLVAEHRPNGPTEEHLVEELAGIMWRHPQAPGWRAGDAVPIS